jgi:pyridoxamine 5'-phosphate oxidase
MPNLDAIRNEFTKNTLRRSEMNASPFLQFTEWMDAAIKAEVPEPTAMTLSTCGSNGRPSSRIVLLKDASEKGFTFFTNYKSRKGLELEATPYASLVFFWPLLERQIRIEGSVEKTDPEVSDTYFNSRPLGSRIAAIVSPQSKVVASRDAYDTLYNRYMAKLSGQNVSRPENWGGFNLKPDYFEFWQGRANRLHDRIRYQFIEKQWVIERLGA